MDLEHLKKLAQLMREHDLTEITLEGDKVRLRRGPANLPQVVPGYVPPPVAEASPLPAAAAAEASGLHIISSPMVGTFYRAPSPDADSFVEVGASIGDETVVCIVEAMKVMNEIPAEAAGEIVEILVEDGDSVQFGTPLFRVRLG